MSSEHVFDIWPSAPPGTEAWSHEEIEFSMPFADDVSKQWRGIRNVVTPRLTVFPAKEERATGAGVIVCPGGGYSILAYDYEGTDVAAWFAARGVTAFLLKYRLEPTPPDPNEFLIEAMKLAQQLQSDPQALHRLTKTARARAVADGVQAMKVVRKHASKFDVIPTRLGMIGFSAGAGVAVGAAVSEPESRPNFVASIYGGDVEDASISSATPPLFAVVSQDDPFRLVSENLRLSQRWIDGGAAADLHIFSEGGHGYGMRELGLMTDQWPSLLERWLRKQGVIEADRTRTPTP